MKTTLLFDSFKLSDTHQMTIRPRALHASDLISE